MTIARFVLRDCKKKPIIARTRDWTEPIGNIIPVKRLDRYILPGVSVAPFYTARRPRAIVLSAIHTPLGVRVVKISRGLRKYVEFAHHSTRKFHCHSRGFQGRYFLSFLWVSLGELYQISASRQTPVDWPVEGAQCDIRAPFARGVLPMQVPHGSYRV